MRRLSAPTEHLKDSYDVVVIGSGYGGGIAASRLARAGKTICVLERGKELQPGEYPRTGLELIEQVQSDLPIGRFGSATGLLDVRYNHDVNVVVGCGLGGTSLINAGIALRPDPLVFQHARWPAEIQGDEAMDRYFGFAEAMLKPAVYPEHYPRLAKFEALQRIAGSMQAPFGRAPILVNFEEFPNGENHIGVEQRPCVGCGDCVSGCNYHSKNTVLMNYLPDAANHGAEIYTGIIARRVEQRGDLWLVHTVDLTTGQARTIGARVVVLAAGTLGSTEVLLRSAEHGLPVSERLGSGFSANGDMVGFVYNADRPVHGVGFGPRQPGELEPVGPCSTGMIDLRGRGSVEDSTIMVEGTVAGALSALMPALLAAAARLTGHDTDFGLRDKVSELSRELESKVFGSHVGAIANTMTCLVVAQDDAAGKMRLEDDRLRIHWPGLGRQTPFARAGEQIRRAAEALGGTYIPNPVWNAFTDHNIVTGHPLGGCVMADDVTAGTVNHKGQVYDTTAKTSVYRGLYVMDGAVVPRSLGVNPLLTISALAERSCRHLAQDYGWTIRDQNRTGRAS